MADHASYPLLNIEPIGNPPVVGESRTVAKKPSFLGRIILADAAIVVCFFHAWIIWFALGGREGLDNGWPLYHDDHPLYYHSALITRSFLSQTGTTSGYDPAFMSGYAKSVIFPASSTLPELVFRIFDGVRPDRLYKIYVLIAASAAPWLIGLAAVRFGASAGGSLLSICLYLIYIWTDFPIAYVTFGMLPYFLGMPLGLLALAELVRFVERGGFGGWLASSILMSLCVLVHFTAAMVVAPAAASVYLVALIRSRNGDRPFPVSRHLGYWSVPLVVLATNAFVWLPGIALAATKGESGFVLANKEPVIERLIEIFGDSPPIQGVLIGFAVVGFPAALRRNPLRGVALASFAAAGFFWGYLAGAFRSLDFLQPGRHTYCFYSCLAIVGGLGWAEVCKRLRATGQGRFDVWAGLALAVVLARLFLPMLDLSISSLLGFPGSQFHRMFSDVQKRAPIDRRSESFLSSRPTVRLLWVVERIDQYMKPGERLLYEEAGFGVPGETDPFASGRIGGGRFSGLLPDRCGIEVIGGPYLHAALTTNFTQFGEGKIFGSNQWSRERFIAYAKLYRPTAIICWSHQARGFCMTNPDLFEIKQDEGRLLFARVKGFEGSTIRGSAEVEAKPGRLTVRSIKPGLDGLAVLRYHSVPCLRSKPEGAWEPVFLEGDPVPFIGVRPSAVPVEFELAFPGRIPGFGR